MNIQILLKEISKMSNAQYFRATNENMLSDIYNQINQLEKVIIKTENLNLKQFELMENLNIKKEIFYKVIELNILNLS